MWTTGTGTLAMPKKKDTQKRYDYRTSLNWYSLGHVITWSFLHKEQQQLSKNTMSPKCFTARKSRDCLTRMLSRSNHWSRGIPLRVVFTYRWPSCCPPNYMTISMYTTSTFCWFMLVYTVQVSNGFTRWTHATDVSFLPATKMRYTVTALKW